jgi:hypothetical protein
VILIAALFSGLAFSQTQDGNLVGSVLDSTGAAIPNAKVEVESIATGVKSTTTSDATGFYRVNNLLVGAYKITASASGLSGSPLQVTVELNKTVTANVTMSVGAVSTEVQVTESAALIDTTNAQVANVYNDRLARDLPIASTNILNLSLIGAGVGSGGGVGVGTGPSVGGQRPRNNNFTIEGSDNNRKDVTGPIVDIPNDAVREFSVLQNHFNAEFGHSYGGQFNAVLNNGGNELHGTAYEYFQNRNLNALDQAFKRQGIFSQPRYDQNVFGGALGGPIMKNKLFFYGLYDRNPLGQASTPSSATCAPTAAGYSALGTIAGLSKTNLDILTKYLSPAPAGGTPCAASVTLNGVKFASSTQVKGTVIPLGIEPIVAPNYTNEARWVGNIDFNQSDRDQWRGRYIDNRVTTIDHSANLPVFFQTRPISRRIISVSEFHTFASNLTNELRLAYNRYVDNIPAGNFQFPGLDVFPNIQIANDLNVQIGPNPNSPQATIQNTSQLVDNVSWIQGRHEWKFGVDARLLNSESTFIQRVRGDYDYTTLEKYLQDLVPDKLAERNVGGKLYVGSNHSFYAFANDNWKVNRNLTLNLGLRYEFTSVPKSMKEFALNSLADVPGVLTFFEPQPQKKNFAPRVGFAYTPGTSADTSVRGGFGIAYDQIFDNIGTNARPPQATSTFDSPVPPAGTDPGNYLATGGIKPTTSTTGLTPAQARAQTSSWLPNQKLGYSINWDLSVQRVFKRDYTVDVRYLGNRGVHLLFQNQINRAAIVTPTHFLPTYLQQPSQATLDALTLTTTSIGTEKNTSGIGNTLAPYGFTSSITAYEPLGNSKYNGLALELTRRFSNNIQFKTAYTWSHLLDDSTAEVNSTTLTPRRPEDFNNIRKEWASSALDRRQRLSFTWVYETPWFSKSSNAFAKNIIGNWQFDGTYIFESPEFATPQSGVDSNQNGDSAGDRVIINNAGVPGTSSDVTALKNTAGATVAYLANNPNAYFILAQVGALTTSGRNILRTRPIDNFDLNLIKNIKMTERYQFQIRADFFNAFNHPQYTPGTLSSVNATNRANVTNYLTPGNALFGQFDQVYSSNPRSIHLGLKLIF